MAKRQITIDDGSKGRKQVELNLNPVNLQPTINSGGNYRVAVQQTPKTNSLLQLSEALKGGVQLYGQAVKVAQTKAEEDVNMMTEEEYDKFLTEGLDPDAKSLFGYTKTYNRMLAQKYYAEEIPKKLQDISTEMFSNYYDYKDADTFEAALNEKTQGVYDEADALLNDNVFGNEANRVLKNAAQNDFVFKERAKFIQELPKRNAELGTQAINRNIEALDDSVLAQGMFGDTTRDIYNNNAGSFRTPQEANEAFYNSVFTRIQTLAESNSTADNKLAEDMLAQIGDGKSVAGVEGSKGIDRTVGGMDIFATGKRQLALTKLDAALEDKMDTAYDDAVKAIQIPVTEFQADTARALASGTPEIEVIATLKKAIEDLETPEGITANPNDTQRDLIAISLKSMLDNPKYFKNEHAKNFYNNNQSILNILYETSVNNLPEGLTEEVSTSYGARRVPVGKGIEFTVDAKLKLAELYTNISIESLKVEGSTERLLKFQELEQQLKTDYNSWADDYLGQASITAEQEETENLTTKFNEASAHDPVLALEYKDDLKYLEAIIKDGEAEDKEETINSSNNVKGFTVNTRFDNFVKASNSKMIDGDDLIRNFNSIHKFNTVSEITAGNAIAYKWRNTFERLDSANKLASKYQVAGIKSDNLLSGSIPRSTFAADSMMGLASENNSRPMSYTELFEQTELTFDEFPIIVKGDIQNTIDAVDAYFNAKGIDQLDEAFLGPFNAIADKYDNINLDSLMQQQRSYLQNYNYIESK